MSVILKFENTGFYGRDKPLQGFFCPKLKGTGTAFSDAVCITDIVKHHIVVRYTTHDVDSRVIFAVILLRHEYA